MLCCLQMKKISTSNRSNNSSNIKLLILLLYCFSGTLLTLLNKLAVIVFPYPNTLLLLQNGTAVIFFVLGSYICRETLCLIPSLNMKIMRLWIPAVLCFVLMLISSLFALRYVSVTAVIVMRNLSTLMVAILEYIFLVQKINKLSIATLVCMLIAAILYAKHDLTFSAPGYTWLCINVIGTSVYQVYVKKIINLPLLKDIGPIGMSFYSNILSLPILMGLSFLMGEIRTILLKFNLEFIYDLHAIGIVLFSCVCGFTLSTSAFALNRLISATSMMVANNVNKFSVIVVSEIFLQSTLDLVASTAAVFALFLGYLYSQASKRFSKSIFVFAIILFTASVSMLEYINRQSGALVAIDKIKGREVYEWYLAKLNPSQNSYHLPPGFQVRKTKEFLLPKICSARNASAWKMCDTAGCIPYNGTQNWTYPLTTNKGERAGGFINRVLEIAWGSNPPAIDLYLRSGCHGIMEMKYLLESIEIFWPRFLGSVLIVLDAGDEVILKQLLPRNPTHHYVIAFEHLPCLPGRILNQYSYLNLDQHCTADYVVTIDSDCVFHSPVTPDLIFRQGKVILASSRTFQKDLWHKSIDAVLGVDYYDAQYMVTQPVTFALSTFTLFRDWFYRSQGVCYEDRIAKLSSEHYPTFCWMCQLGTYLERGSPPKNDYEQYWYQDLDNPTLQPMLRYAIHVPYEPNGSNECREPICHGKNANEIITQGLCRAFGPSVFKQCTDYNDFSYVDKSTFFYANADIMAANASARAKALKEYLQRLSNVTKIALRAAKRYLK